MEGAADQPEETRLDATQQILAAYGAMTTVLLDLLLEKSIVDLAELRKRLDEVLRDAPALQPHGKRAIEAQLSAVMHSTLLRSVPSCGSLPQ